MPPPHTAIIRGDAAVPRPQPFCIAGMHRSGTSMVARLLNLAGAYLGEPADLYPPQPDNPAGYWEHIRFVQLNEQILDELGGAWDCPPSPSPRWWMDDALGDLRRAAKLLVSEFPAHLRWGWKDPRNSLTLPFWRELLPELRVVICLRNPLEVALSLQRRAMHSRRFSLSLWRTYNERALESVPPQARLVANYESFFSAPLSEARRILGFLGIDTTDASLRASVAAFDPGLRRARHPEDGLSAGAPSDVLALYERMTAEAEALPPPEPEPTAVPRSEPQRS